MVCKRRGFCRFCDFRFYGVLFRSVSVSFFVNWFWFFFGRLIFLFLRRVSVVRLKTGNGYVICFWVSFVVESSSWFCLEVIDFSGSFFGFIFVVGDFRCVCFCRI